MNIKQAKEQIKNAMIAYFTKDENGDYVLPIERQRPVFLIGAPGIGKTAIMEQIASEMGVGLLSYSMTHHTRQSALGLPFIVHKNYDGKEFDVSEYTMSEIISSVYDLMEKTGLKEGILFLDEINCVSETLSPIMLQFLQYKVFGRHRVPDGWIVVTAGNPPEYNNSVREFDIVTWDRLKRVDVEPDFNVWKEYAVATSIHPAVVTYLEIRSGDFYSVESTVDGKRFVTARGWEDLSRMIRLYEQNNITVDLNLIGQYLQNAHIARSFAQYYDLFRKYKSDYKVEKILDGTFDPVVVERAQKAKFDERLSLIGLLLDAIRGKLSDVIIRKTVLTQLMESIKTVRIRMVKPGAVPEKCVLEAAEAVRAKLAAGQQAASISATEQKVLKQVAKHLESMAAKIFEITAPAKAFEVIKKEFDALTGELKKAAAGAGKQLSNMFTFAEDVFGEGQEMLIIVTELTAHPDSATFIANYGCKEYFRHNKDLLLHERGMDINAALKELDLGTLVLTD